MLQNIIVKGATENNLKNLDVTIPRNKLVVFTGVSGSGKSSLAFGTIFAEGQRRFMESLSSYARQFLGNMQKPAVEYIEGLSPAISIDQKTTSHNPRSTVGTVTEIYDYLRLLYARVGEPYCPQCNKKITRQSVDQIVGQLYAQYRDAPDNALITIEAPVVRGQKGTFAKELDSYKRSGYARVKIDGSMYMLDEPITLDKNIRHNISIIMDRVRVAEGEQTRINEAIENALRLTDGLVVVTHGEEERLFSNKYACIDCGINIEELEPRSFSFNSPFGACPNCSGLGFTMEIDENQIIPNKNMSIAEGAIMASGWNMDGKIAPMYFAAFAKVFKISLHHKIRDISPDIIHKLLYGCDEKLKYEFKGATYDNTYLGKYEGIIPNLKRRYHETNSDFMKQEISKLMINTTCPVCNGKRLRREALAVRVGNTDIHALTNRPINQILDFFDKLTLSKTKALTAEQIIKEVRARLNFLVNVGLHYLTLARSADSLSGGESQRIRLATQIGSGLVGVLYILDEPSIGLHQRDNEKLLGTLTRLRDLGNTLIVVEHDEDTIRQADYIVDIGPRAGVNGGELVIAGTVEEVASCPDSITGAYLRGERKIEAKKSYRPLNDKFVEVIGAQQNNLKKVTARFPLGVLTAVTGVSGSGKSSLINKILYPALSNALNRSQLSVGKHKEIKFDKKHLDKVIEINQSPIGRTPRSNPATYTGVFTQIRDLFAQTKDARERGYQPGRFSFNVRGGRCDNCDGEGTTKIEMHFLPDVFVQCEVCKGKRFNTETLMVRFKGKNIHDVLDMTVDEATEFFQNIPAIHKKIKTLADVGLGYIKLGQSATTLSGGEAQRVKLATELSRTATGRTIYILDEPTTGLHTYDVQKLIGILERLVDNGNTVIVIEHNLDIIKIADHIIDLGPEGGEEGGQIVATGTPVEVANNPASITGLFLKKVL
jgi:excinuclease ABC subunit A